MNIAPFAPHPLVRGGNRQTLYATLFRRIVAPPMSLERWPTPDGDQLRVHLAVPPESTRVAVLFHGLEGSIQSPYLAGIAHALLRAGYGVVAAEHRSCGEAPLEERIGNAPRLYHLADTGDLALVVKGVATRFPNAALFAVGYSAGGNQLCKWLGESAHEVPSALHAAAVVSAPYDLLVTGPHLDGVLGGLYTRVFLRSLIPKALKKAAQFPGRIDVERVRNATTFKEFDHHATAAFHGFDSAEHYWHEASCGRFLDEIRVPTLLLSAKDDPFNPAITLPAPKNPRLTTCFSKQGGHVGFVGGRVGGPVFWSERVILKFFAES